MQLPKPIFSLKGKASATGTAQEVISSDVPGLQKLLTKWLRAGGSGFIYRLFP